MFVMSKKLKEIISLLGIQKVTKESKVKQNVFENITDAIKAFGRSRRKDTSIAGRAVRTTIISASTRHKCLMTQLEKKIGTLRKTLYKHNKFCLQIDENDELACWEIICR